MRLKRVRLHDIGPFEDVEVNFDQIEDWKKLVAICGPNGAGKTTLLESAFPGALFRACPTRGSLVDLATSRSSFVESEIVNGKAWTFRHSLDSVSKKSEAVILDEDGKPVLPSAKVRDFDRWVAKHLPTPEIVYACEFSCQQAQGLIGATAGARKAVVLRLMGVEHVEELARRARDHASSVKTDLDGVRMRIEDEHARGGDVAAIELELSELRTLAATKSDELFGAKAALDVGRAEAPRIEFLQKTADEQRDKRRTIAGKVDAARTTLADIDERIRNNRAVLAEGDEIRAAAKRAAELPALIARLEEEAKLHVEKVAAARSRAQTHAQAERAARDRAAAARDRARAARDRAAAARDRAQRAHDRAAGRTEIEAAAASLPHLEEALRAAQAAVTATAAELEAVRELRVSGAEERVISLRDGHEELIDLYDDGRATAEALADVSAAAIRRDDEAIRSSTEVPKRMGAAEVAARAAHDAEVTATTALSQARATAARAESLASAEQDAAAADADALTADNEAAASDTEAVGADNEATEAGHAEGLARADVDVLERLRHGATEKTAAARSALAQAEPIAKKAGALANAEGRIAELEPQAATARASLSALEAELAATPEPEPVPPAPKLDELEAAVRTAETAVREADAEIARVGERLKLAQESAEKLDLLDVERRRLGDELADWTRLGADLGRDGLQAMLVDAAGPEITTLSNDLLHAAFGPRFTVRLDTQRLGSDGRLLETYEIVVIDTVAGREASAETLSPGERVIISEALSLAFTMISCRQHGIERPTLVRDEAGAALDPDRARQWIAMLRRCVELANVDRILLVSHSREVQELCDERIDVTKWSRTAAE